MLHQIRSPLLYPAELPGLALFIANKESGFVSIPRQFTNLLSSMQHKARALDCISLHPAVIVTRKSAFLGEFLGDTPLDGADFRM
jgi:hypothetical protein